MCLQLYNYLNNIVNYKKSIQQELLHDIHHSVPSCLQNKRRK